MNSLQLYDSTCLECSRLITRRYSSSFSMGIRLFEVQHRDPIYAIYGFVRFADEIVDTFLDKDKELLLRRFRADTFLAIEERISLNPVLQSFQQAVHKFNIEHSLIEAFLDSMEMDLHQSKYETYSDYNNYIYGSAEVVGLMCLKAFVNGDAVAYEHLKPSACRLGAAFQKINFLRDIKSDYEERGRIYFPGVDFKQFTNEQKLQIESDIQADFDAGLEGIRQLPKSVRLGVYVAYIYYTNLFQKIKQTSAKAVSTKRIRVADSKKAYLLIRSAVQNNFNLI